VCTPANSIEDDRRESIFWKFERYDIDQI